MVGASNVNGREIDASRDCLGAPQPRGGEGCVRAEAEGSHREKQREQRDPHYPETTFVAAGTAADHSLRRSVVHTAALQLLWPVRGRQHVQQRTPMRGGCDSLPGIEIESAAAGIAAARVFDDMRGARGWHGLELYY